MPSVTIKPTLASIRAARRAVARDLDTIRKSVVIKWMKMESCFLGMKRGDGRGLALIVMPTPKFQNGRMLTRYAATAVESSLEAKGIDGVFDDHAHAIIAQDVSYREAVRASERFGQEWVLGKPLTQCGCGEIPVRKPQPRRRLASTRKRAA